MSTSIFSILGDDHSGLVEAVTDVLQQHSANILDSRMTLLGKVFAMIIMVDVSDEHKQRLLDELNDLASRESLTVQEHGTAARDASNDFRLYTVEVMSLDHPGIVHDVSAFFSQRACNIRDLSTQITPAPHTGAPMFSAKLVVEVPAQQSIAALKESLFSLADELNLDCDFEPVRSFVM